MEKIAVTGSEGFIGKHVMNRLPDAIPYDLRLGNDIRHGFPEADVIIHLAAFIDIKDSFENPQLYFENNTIPISLIPKGKRVIFASSAAVYGDYSPYGMSKRLAELLLPKDSVIFRIFNPFGPGENHEPETHLIPKLMTGEATVYNNGEAVRNFVHVEDIARAIELAALGNFRGTYDLCADEPLSLKEVVDLMDVKVSYQNKPRDPGDTMILNGDNTLLKSKGWKPEVDIKQALKDWRKW